MDNGGFSRRRGVYVPLSSNLNLADATFNGVALGGDRADGTAFDGFNNNRLIGYAGILSGTNLGAPLTDTEGSAKWIGSYRFGGSFPTDFVLNVSFGTGDGAGEIEAVMQKFFTYKGYDFDYHIAGEFDDTGVITGRAWRESYMTNDPNNRGSIYDATGTLTGLIGEEGAVGAFILNGAAGGFVARPPSEEELRTLEQTCADDPFHKLCVSQQYQQARANRKAFCRTAGNEGNALCTFNSTFAHICTHHPFDAQCLGDSDYTPFRRAACTDDPFATRCAGDAYNDLRVSFCENKAGNPACPTPEPTTPQVTASVWADSFDEDLAHGVTAEDTESKFLIARATDLDTGEVSVGVPDYSRNYVNLNLADATFNGVALGGDRADGAAFFAFIRADDGLVYNYAGILEGTNLGAPLTDTSGSAKWLGSFKVTHWTPVDFVLNVSFGTGDGAGEIEAVIPNGIPYSYSYSHFDYRIVGEFDDAGVITGTAQQGIFRTNDPNNRGSVTDTGKLTGLIGEEGAVGAFIITDTVIVMPDYFGGFVARPSSAEELRTLDANLHR